jgi:hypothetical protein
MASPDLRHANLHRNISDASDVSGFDNGPPNYLQDVDASLRGHDNPSDENALNMPQNPDSQIGSKKHLPVFDKFDNWFGGRRDLA